jgi:RNA polymerase sigma factor (TIGR02999 family)
MYMENKEAVTALLEALTEGREGVMDELMPLVYAELRGIAHRRLSRERGDHTLNTTALVHEAYLKLVRLDRIEWKGRAHFFALAGQAMRNILVTYAYRRKRIKRGGGTPHITFEEAQVLSEERADRVLALDEALKELAVQNERHSRIVECRFFAGLTIEETAEVLGISTATVKRDWRLLRAWLQRALRDEEAA